MKLVIPKNTTSKTIQVFIPDASQTDGSGLIGLDATEVTVYYYKEGDSSATYIPTVDMDTGTWVSGGFTSISGMPGVYQIGLPNAMLTHDATSADAISVILMIYDGGTATDTNISPTLVEIQLGPVNSDVHFVLTNEVGTDAAIDSNVIQWNGTTIDEDPVGIPSVNVKYVDGIETTLQNYLDSNVKQWNDVDLTDHDFIGVDANVINWNSDSEPVLGFGASMPTAVRGTAVTGTLSNTQMTTNLTSAVEEYYTGRLVIWTTGDLEDVARVITAYTAAGGMLTYAALPGALAPSALDEFVII